MGNGYINKQVAEIIGMEPSRIAFYSNKGIVVPSISTGRGRGSNRLYSKKDMLKLLMIRELGRRGLSLESIREALEQTPGPFMNTIPDENYDVLPIISGYDFVLMLNVSKALCGAGGWMWVNI